MFVYYVVWFCMEVGGFRSFLIYEVGVFEFFGNFGERESMVSVFIEI